MIEDSFITLISLLWLLLFPLFKCILGIGTQSSPFMALVTREYRICSLDSSLSRNSFLLAR